MPTLKYFKTRIAQSELDDWVSIGKDMDFSLDTTAKPALGPNQPDIQCVPVVLSSAIRWPAREAGDYLQRVPRLIISGLSPPLPLYVVISEHKNNFIRLRPGRCKLSEYGPHMFFPCPSSDYGNNT